LNREGNTAMKMYVIDNGKMWLDRAGLVAGLRTGTMDNKHPNAEWVDIPVGTFLFEHPDGLVLFDTACDPEGMAKNWPEYNKQVSPHEAAEGETLPERLAQLGYHPEDIKYVVISHLHTDHAGCLKLFKNAEVFVNEAEFTEALKIYALRDPKPAYILSDIKGWLDAGLHWNLVGSNEKEVRLLDGLTIVNLGSGHAFGMMGLLAELEHSGNFLLVSDALYAKENLGPPIRLPGLVYDSLGYTSTAKFIGKYAAQKKAQILFGHDKEQFTGLIKSTEGYYE